MKKLLVLLFSTLMSFNSYGGIVCIETDYVQIRNGLYYQPNQQEPFTGENLCVYKGSLKNHSKGSILNGFQEGKWTSWYKSGQKKSELNYTNGLLDGDWLSWFEDGSPSGEGGFINGTGEYFQWYENFQSFMKVSYKDGNKNGLETLWFENGQKEYEINWKDGLRDGKDTGWRRNGQIMSEWNWKDGHPDGKNTMWGRNGQIKQEFIYKDGVVIEDLSPILVLPSYCNADEIENDNNFDKCVNYRINEILK
jgi:antitoxin component YwqK of YwqJK toxin-antitoxin module